MANFWARAGRDVAVIVPEDRESAFFELHPEVLHLGLAGWGRLGRRLRERLSDLGVDAVLAIADGGGAAAEAAAAGRALHLPTVLASGNTPAATASARGWRGLRAYRRAVRRAPLNVVPCERAAAELRSLVPAVRKLEIVPSFAPAGSTRANIPGAASGPAVARSPEAQILAVGSLEPHNGFELLLRAFARIRAEFPEWGVRIVGGGSEEAALATLAAELGIEHAVELTGVVEDTMPYYRTAEIFALPARRKAFPNTLLEAMQSGLPCVAYDCPAGPREIIGHRASGIVVPPHSTDLFAEALAELIRDSRLRKRFGARGRELAERHSPSAIMPLWERMLSSARARSK